MKKLKIHKSVSLDFHRMSITAIVTHFYLREKFFKMSKIIRWNETVAITSRLNKNPNKRVLFNQKYGDIVRLSCDFITFYRFVVCNEAFDWPNLSCFRMTEFGWLYFSTLLYKNKESSLWKTYRESIISYKWWHHHCAMFHFFVFSCC